MLGSMRRTRISLAVLCLLLGQQTCARAAQELEGFDDVEDDLQPAASKQPEAEVSWSFWPLLRVMVQQAQVSCICKP